MKLYLAPMEGVVDWVLRDLLTRIGGIDQCVTEFVRVTSQLVPDHVFLDYCPELKTNSKTLSGVPVFIQLLGGQPNPMSENAHKAAELGACGIDLNFGCPAKTVNRHDGGAVLLKEPERIFKIAEAVRAAVPKEIPVTAKIRLGFDDPSLCLENAKAIEAAGLHVLTVHCRTKTDMYKPPAYWEWIPKIKSQTSLTIVANGEIWTSQDLAKCKAITNCEHFMLGRGAIADPYLFKKIKNPGYESNWEDLKPLLCDFFIQSEKFKTPYFAQSRTKQWLNQISKRHNSEALKLFERVKRIKNPNEFSESLTARVD